MKRFLFVTYHFPPSVGGGIARVVSFARDLPRHGWAATVLTSTPHGAAAVDDASLASLPPETRVVRAYCPLASAGTRGHERVRSGARGLLQRMALATARFAMFPEPFAPWMPFALKAGREALEREPHDAIVATYGPPANLLVGAALAKLSGLPLILDFRDLWSDLPFMDQPTRVHAAALAALERWIVRDAFGITTVSDGMSNHIRDRFQLPADRVVTILNGFDEGLIDYVRDDRSAKGRPFTICYSGSVYAAYDVRPFVRAIRKLADAGTITPESFKFLTLGNFPRDVIANEGVERFHEREGYLKRADMFARFSDVDAFLAIESGEYGSRMGYPVKVFDYLLTGKPILALVVPDGNCARLLVDMGMTELPRNEEDAIARSLTALLATRGKPPAEVKIDRPPLSRFRREHNARALADLLDAAIGRELTRASA